MEIVCTVGPSTFNRHMIRMLGYVGVTVFRLNLSYTNDLNELDDFVDMVASETRGKTCIDTHGRKHRPYGVDDFTWFDEEALKRAADLDVKLVAVSFARNGYAIKRAKTLSGAKVAAKIEDMVGVENSSEIIGAADVVLIDRGDLSKSVPIEDVPSVCINLIHTCKELDTPVWVATNLLESMVTQPLPTLAEVNDIASLILQGVDGLVLAAETAIGKYPVQCVEFVRKMSERYKV